MPNNIEQYEKRMLTFSALLSFAFSFMGIALGIWVGSLVIVFDGVYSLVSLLLTLLSIAASIYIKKGSKSAEQYGKTLIEPCVVAIKGAVILAIVCVSLYSAVVALFNGGREVDPSIATVFGAINVAGCCYAWWYLKRHSKQASTTLIVAEIKQWQMDALISVAVMLGFISSWLLSVSSWSSFSSYADPVMMLLMSFYFIKVPCEMIFHAGQDISRGLSLHKCRS